MKTEPVSIKPMDGVTLLWFLDWELTTDVWFDDGYLGTYEGEIYISFLNAWKSQNVPWMK